MRLLQNIDWLFICMVVSAVAISDVYSVCEDGDVRLTETTNIENAANNSGRLEVCLNNEWGTVAADSFTTPWSEKNAQVACRQLGFSGALNSIFQSTTTIEDRANSSVPVHYSGVVCDGTETRLENCTHNKTAGSFSHLNDVFIVCRPGIIDGVFFGPYSALHFNSPSVGDVRLLGSPDNGAGAVEIFTNTLTGWTGICPDSSWTDEDAGAVCRAQGYESGVARTFQIPNDAIEYRQATDVQCGDNQVERPGLLSAGVCSVLFDRNCTLQENSYAGVVCTPSSSTSGSVRLFGGEDACVGAVEVLYDGRWGVICEEGFSIRSAKVICAEVGYNRVSEPTIIGPLRLTQRESSLKPLWLNNINCSSSATSLSDCQHDGVVGFADCPLSNNIVVVNCSNCEDGETRLFETESVRSFASNAGRLEVCLNNEWGTIAADSFTTPWSEKNAQVACRQLGFSGALNSIFQSTVPVGDRADGDVPVHYSEVICNGTESRLEDCSLNRSTGSFSHLNDVYIVCRPTPLEDGSRTIPYTDLHTPGPNPGDIRLLGSPKNGAGAVEIFTNTVTGWTGICPDSSWTNEGAGAVCRALGYETGVTRTFEISNGAITQRQASDVQCTDDRMNRAEFISAGVCSLSLSGGGCTAQENVYAGVECLTPNTSIPGTFRFVGTMEEFEAVGLVEVLYDSRWGVVCDVGSSTTAEVLCEQLGYDRNHYRTSTLSTFSNSYPNNESSLKPLWLDNINCSSSESTLSQCQHDEVIGLGRCFRLAGVTCGKDKPPESGLVGGLIGLGASLFFIVCVCMVGILLVFVVRAHLKRREEHMMNENKGTSVAMTTRNSSTTPLEQELKQESYPSVKNDVA